MDKSELLLIRGTARTKINEEIKVSIESQPVPAVERLRILGLQLQQDGKATYTVKVPRKRCQQIAHLIRRVTGKRKGLKESDTLRIVQALLVSRVVNHAPPSRTSAAARSKRWTPHSAQQLKQQSASRNTHLPNASSS